MRTHSPGPTTQVLAHAGELFADQAQAGRLRRDQIRMAEGDSHPSRCCRTAATASARPRPAPGCVRARAPARCVRWASAGCRRPVQRSRARRRSAAASGSPLIGETPAAARSDGRVEVAEADAGKAHARPCPAVAAAPAPTARHASIASAAPSRKRGVDHNATSGCTPSSSTANAPCPPRGGNQAGEQAFVDADEVDRNRQQPWRAARAPRALRARRSARHPATRSAIALESMHRIRVVVAIGADEDRGDLRHRTGGPAAGPAARHRAPARPCRCRPGASRGRRRGCRG